MALRGRVHAYSAFERKHYFYHDLPAGYQITQLEHPVMTQGAVYFHVHTHAHTHTHPHTHAHTQARTAGATSAGAGAAAAAPARKPGKAQELYKCAARITRVQLEHDTGKSTHTHTHTHTPGQSTSLIDFNRAGVGLLEIVTEPDFRSPAEAAAFVRELRAILRTLRVSSASMDDGSMRVDVNVSVRPRALFRATQDGQPSNGLPTDGRGRRAQRELADDGSVHWRFQYVDSEVDPWRHGPADVKGLGSRVEIKNLNSLRSVVRAIEVEFARQTALLEAGRGHEIQQETRSFDAGTGATTRMRSKEGENDYRFLPEPDIQPLLLSNSFVSAVSASIPRLPDEWLDVLQREYALPASDARLLTYTLRGPEVFEALYVATAARVADFSLVGIAAPVSAINTALARSVTNWLCNEIFGRIGVSSGVEELAGGDAATVAAATADVALDDQLRSNGLAVDNVAELVAMVHTGFISGKVGKDVLTQLVASRGAEPPAAIVARNGWQQLNDPAQIEAAAAQVIADPQMAASLAKYRSGHERVAGVFVAKVLERTGGRANPTLANEAVMKLLGPCPPRRKQ